MVPFPPTSVLLPTVRYTAVIDDLAAQLGPDDELLVICDAPDDPVALATETGGLPDGVRLVLAGDPDGCSGKANAIAEGIDAARNHRLVWTDDDFHHPSDWLERLHADYDRHGPVSEVPFFVGRDPLSILFEPLYAIGGTFGLYATGKAWGGAVMFDRTDLDEAAFLAELRQTISDDGLLSEWLDVTCRRRYRRVEVGGTFRESLERHARFMQIVWRHSPLVIPVLAVLAILGTIGGIQTPIRSVVVSTLTAGAVSAFFGVPRWTVLLAYPAFVLNPLLLGYGLARRTFVWGGRRYRWASKFDVRIVEE
jgi:hypothetical protein